LTCKNCVSENCRTFSGELAVHFPGIEGLLKPIIWIFPQILACLDCGFAEFVVPESELRVLRTGVPESGSTVSLDEERESS
jgi:hypothetical protein